MELENDDIGTSKINYDPVISLIKMKNSEYSNIYLQILELKSEISD